MAFPILKLQNFKTAETEEIYVKRRGREGTSHMKTYLKVCTCSCFKDTDGHDVKIVSRAGVERRFRGFKSSMWLVSTVRGDVRRERSKEDKKEIISLNFSVGGSGVAKEAWHRPHRVLAELQQRR